MGTGKKRDSPNPQNGSCWSSPNINTNITWGEWDLLDDNYKLSQSFSYINSKDIKCDVTDIVNGWYDGSIDNFGFLLKFPQIVENEDISYFAKFFSIDTHTIYPPHIEIYWDDTTFNSSLNVINNSDFVTTITNLQSEFTEGEKYKFRIKNRDKYPVRSFQTSSLYLNNKILPENTLWALKDVKTEEIVIDYNNLGTRVGADNKGNYFNLDLNGLQPERYYQILFKSEIENEIIIIDDKKSYFKLVR
jgi:hypothetical protein